MLCMETEVNLTWDHCQQIDSKSKSSTNYGENFDSYTNS